MAFNISGHLARVTENRKGKESEGKEDATQQDLQVT
jgi:hypothetical protein